MKNRILILVLGFILFCIPCTVAAETAWLLYEYEWTAPGALYDIASNGENIAAVGSDGRIYISAGETWQAVGSNVFGDFFDIEYGNGLYYAVGNRALIASKDGYQWNTVATDITYSNQGILYYNGSSFLITNGNLVYNTIDFDTFTLVGQTTDGIFGEIQSNEKINDLIKATLGEQSNQTELSAEEYFSLLFGDAGQTDNKSFTSRMKMFARLNSENSLPVKAEDVVYFERKEGEYRLYYVSDYMLMCASSTDMHDWTTRQIDLPEKNDHLYEVSINYNGEYLLSYHTNERLGYGYVKKYVSTLDMVNFEDEGYADMEAGRDYLFHTGAYILNSNSVYRLEELQSKQKFALPEITERSTIKSSNGKYVKWTYEDTICIYLSDDCETWQKVENPDALLTERCGTDGVAYYDIIWDGKRYLVRPTTSDNGYNPTGESGMLIVCDSSFRVTDTIPFDSYILDMAYVTNQYHVLTEKDGADHVSSDLQNWQQGFGDMHIKVGNGSTEVIKKLEKSENGYVITQEQEKIIFHGTEKPVVFENPFGDKLCVDNGLYIKTERSKVSVSCDGVYWHTIEIPEDKTISNVFLRGEILCVITNGVSFQYNIAGICTQQPIYVELNGTILAFDTEPVMESDRVLVPLRFIFEQLGADVDWKNDSQTAVVKNEDTTICFSVDNTTATINGAEKVMDVPARMINDKTLVPLRFLSEELGFNVEWDQETQTATIRK